MPKATVLTPEALNPIATRPTAATSPRKAIEAASPAEPNVPLQIRVPRPELKAIKVAAAESEQTISDFMLACFHAYMKSGRHE